MLRDPRIVYGGGAAEISCSLTVSGWADSVKKIIFNYFRSLQLNNMQSEHFRKL